MKYKNQRWNNFLTTLLKYFSKLWIISKAHKKNVNCIPTLKQNNRLCATTNEKAEILTQNFS